MNSPRAATAVSPRRHRCWLVVAGATRQELTRRVVSGSRLIPVWSWTGSGWKKQAAPGCTGSPGRLDRRLAGTAPLRMPVESPVGSFRNVECDAQADRAVEAERSERWLLAMCVAKPEEGREWLAKLDTRHLQLTLIERTVAWLKTTSMIPAQGPGP